MSLFTKMLGRGRNIGLLVTMAMCLLVISLFSPKYLSIDNLLVIALQISFTGIAAIGTAYLIIGGSVDLSIGSQYALCAVVSAMMARSVPSVWAWIGGIVLGQILGVLNGLMVWRVRISPIIITLGTLTIFRGIALRITNGFGVRGVPKSFSLFGQSQWVGIPIPVWVFIVLAMFAHFVLQYTQQGRHLFAFGGNREAAEAAGIDGKRLLLSCFVLNGALVGTSAVLAASRFGTAAPTFGTGFELDVIAAVILGGVVFSGGEGSIIGVLLAVVLLGVINSGLISIGVDPHYAQVAKGLALVIAVTIDQLTQENQERHRKKLALLERETVA
jgi:ribose transport system permease protein